MLYLESRLKITSLWNSSKTAWKVSLFRVILVRFFPHLDWIWTRITPNADSYCKTSYISHYVNFYWISCPWVWLLYQSKRWKNGDDLNKRSLHKKLSSPLRISSVNVTKSAGTADLVIFTEEILHGKLHFLCSGLDYVELFVFYNILK